jgi:ribosomal protein S21
VNNSGVLLEARARQEYIKPSTKRKIAKSSAKKRWQKYLNQQQLPSKFY